MGIAKLEAFIRDQKGYKVRRQNFVPGVIYGKGVETTSVKINRKDADKVIKDFGSRAKLTVVFNGKESFGFIKDTARDGLTGELIHMDIQVVDEESEITRSIPIVFKGTDILTYNKLILQTQIYEVDIKGKAKLIPDAIEVDVSNAKSGDTIMLSDIKFPEGVTYVSTEDSPVAVVIEARESQETQEDETEAEAEDESKTDEAE